MATKSTAINSTGWTEIADLTHEYLRHLVLSREEEIDFDIAYDPNPTTAILRITSSFLAIELDYFPSGGKIYAKSVSGTATIVANWS